MRGSLNPALLLLVPSVTADVEGLTTLSAGSGGAAPLIALLASVMLAVLLLGCAFWRKKETTGPTAGGGRKPPDVEMADVKPAPASRGQRNTGLDNYVECREVSYGREVSGGGVRIGSEPEISVFRPAHSSSQVDDSNVVVMPYKEGRGEGLVLSKNRSDEIYVSQVKDNKISAGQISDGDVITAVTFQTKDLTVADFNKLLSFPSTVKLHMMKKPLSVSVGQLDVHIPASDALKEQDTTLPHKSSSLAEINTNTISRNTNNNNEFYVNVPHGSRSEEYLPMDSPKLKKSDLDVTIPHPELSRIVSCEDNTTSADLYLEPVNQLDERGRGAGLSVSSQLDSGTYVTGDAITGVSTLDSPVPHPDDDRHGAGDVRVGGSFYDGGGGEVVGGGDVVVGSSLKKEYELDSKVPHPDVTRDSTLFTVSAESSSLQNVTLQSADASAAIGTKGAKDALPKANRFGQEGSDMESELKIEADGSEGLDERSEILQGRGFTVSTKPHNDLKHNQLNNDIDYRAGGSVDSTLNPQEDITALKLKPRPIVVTKTLEIEVIRQDEIDGHVTSESRINEEDLSLDKINVALPEVIKVNNKHINATTNNKYTKLGEVNISEPEGQVKVNDSMSIQAADINSIIQFSESQINFDLPEASAEDSSKKQGDININGNLQTKDVGLEEGSVKSSQSLSEEASKAPVSAKIGGEETAGMSSSNLKVVIAPIPQSHVQPQAQRDQTTTIPTNQTLTTSITPPSPSVKPVTPPTAPSKPAAAAAAPAAEAKSPKVGFGSKFKDFFKSNKKSKDDKNVTVEQNSSERTSAFVVGEAEKFIDPYLTEPAVTSGVRAEPKKQEIIRDGSTDYVITHQDPLLFEVRNSGNNKSSESPARQQSIEAEIHSSIEDLVREERDGDREVQINVASKRNKYLSKSSHDSTKRDRANAELLTVLSESLRRSDSNGDAEVKVTVPSKRSKYTKQQSEVTPRGDMSAALIALLSQSLDQTSPPPTNSQSNVQGNSQLSDQSSTQTISISGLGTFKPAQTYNRLGKASVEHDATNHLAHEKLAATDSNSLGHESFDHSSDFQDDSDMEFGQTVVENPRLSRSSEGEREQAWIESHASHYATSHGSSDTLRASDARQIGGELGTDDLNMSSRTSTLKASSESKPVIQSDINYEIRAGDERERHSGEALSSVRLKGMEESKVKKMPILSSPTKFKVEEPSKGEITISSYKQRNSDDVSNNDISNSNKYKSFAKSSDESIWRGSGHAESGGSVNSDLFPDPPNIDTSLGLVTSTPSEKRKVLKHDSQDYNGSYLSDGSQSDSKDRHVNGPVGGADLDTSADTYYTAYGETGDDTLTDSLEDELSYKSFDQLNSSGKQTISLTNHHTIDTLNNHQPSTANQQQTFKVAHRVTSQSDEDSDDVTESDESYEEEESYEQGGVDTRRSSDALEKFYYGFNKGAASVDKPDLGTINEAVTSDSGTVVSSARVRVSGVEQSGVRVSTLYMEPLELPVDVGEEESQRTSHTLQLSSAHAPPAQKSRTKLMIVKAPGLAAGDSNNNVEMRRD